MANPAVIQSATGEGPSSGSQSVHEVAATLPGHASAGNALVFFGTLSDFAGIHTGLTAKDKTGNTWATIDQENTGGGGTQTIASYLSVNISADAVGIKRGTTNVAKTSTTATSLTWSHVCDGAANCLVVTEGNSASGGGLSPTGIAFNGIALTKAPSSGIINGNFESSIWYLLNPPAGYGLNIVASYASTRMIGCSSVSLIGVNTTTPLGAAATASGSSVATAAVTATGGTTGDAYISSVIVNATAISSGGSQTVISSNPNINSSVSTSQDTIPGASTGAFTWTGGGTTGTGWAASAVAFKADPTAGDVVTQYFIPDTVEDFMAGYIVEVGNVAVSPYVGKNGSVQNGLASGTNNCVSGTITVTSGQVPCLMVALCMNTSVGGSHPTPTVGTGMTHVGDCWAFGGTNGACVATQLITTAGNYQAVFNQASSSSEDMATTAMILMAAPTASDTFYGQICL